MVSHFGGDLLEMKCRTMCLILVQFSLPPPPPSDTLTHARTNVTRLPLGNNIVDDHWLKRRRPRGFDAAAPTSDCSIPGRRIERLLDCDCFGAVCDRELKLGTTDI